MITTENRAEWIKPEEMYADAAANDWQNSLWRIWFILFEGNWYAGSAHRNAAGQCLVDLSAPCTAEYMQAMIKKYKLKKVVK